MSKETAMAKVPSKKEVTKMAMAAGIATSMKINVAKPKYKHRNKTKEQLIRDLQVHEGNTACFNTDVSDCSQSGCTWFGECQK